MIHLYTDPIQAYHGPQVLLFAFIAISFHWDFDSGNLARVEPQSVDHYLCHVNGETDQDGRNRQASWYYFRVDGAKGHALTIDIVDLPGEYNYQPNRGAITKDTPPFYSDDRETWHPVESAEFDDSVPRLRIRITPHSDHLWIAHVPPYTGENLTRLLTNIATSSAIEKTTVGKTVGGRDIPLLTITDPTIPDSAKKVIWLLFRQHAWEAGSSWAADGMIRYLASSDATASRIRRTTIVKILPLCDPDGVARGGVRFNAHHYDLNRNWDVDDPVKMPEIAAERKAIFDWIGAGHRIDLLLTLHNTETSEYLDGPPDPTAAIRALTDRLHQAMQQSTTFAASRPPEFVAPTTTAGKSGRMNAPQGLYHDRKIPAFLIEQRIARHPKLGRQPNIADRQRFGVELIQALTIALSDPLDTSPRQD